MAKYFIQQAGRTPDNIAVVWENDNNELQSISYNELLKSSYQLAKYLQIHGLSHGQRLGICLPRTVDYVLALLACWHLGLVYVPLSDASLDRLREKKHESFKQKLAAFDLDSERSLLTALLVHPGFNATDFNCSSEKCIVFPRLKVAKDAAAINVHVQAEDEAYVFCSSGTTGKPKIIAIPYEGIYARINSAIVRLGVQANEGVLNYTPFDFDPSVMEIFMALWTGATLYIVPERVRLGEQTLADYNHRINEKNWPKLAHAIFLPSVLKSTIGYNLLLISSESKVLQASIPMETIVLRRNEDKVDAFFIKNARVQHKILAYTEELCSLPFPNEPSIETTITQSNNKNLVEKIALKCGCTAISPWDFSELRSLLITGENYDREWLAAWFTDGCPEGRSRSILNGFGPTETTFGATLTEIKPEGSITLNEPMDEVEVWLSPLPVVEEQEKVVLDNWITLQEALRKDSFTHEEWEIYISGTGIGKYIGQDADERNNKRFVYQQNKKYFRTRDSVKIIDHQCIFLGRLDRTFKYHGRWASLDELEYQCSDAWGVKAIAVEYQTEMRRNTNVIFVFLHTNDNIDLWEKFKVLDYRPALFWRVEKLPQNDRDKWDRNLSAFKDCQPKHLKIYDNLNVQQDQVLIRVAAIWRESLQQDYLEEDFSAAIEAITGESYYPENFETHYLLDWTFDEVGGDSLLFIKLMNRLWQELKREGTATYLESLFKAALLRHRSLGAMTEIFRLYEGFKSRICISKEQPEQNQYQKIFYISLTQEELSEETLNLLGAVYQIVITPLSNLNFSKHMWLKEWFEVLQCFLEHSQENAPYHLIIAEKLKECDPTVYQFLSELCGDKNRDIYLTEFTEKTSSVAWTLTEKQILLSISETECWRNRLEFFKYTYRKIFVKSKLLALSRQQIWCENKIKLPKIWKEDYQKTKLALIEKFGKKMPQEKEHGNTDYIVALYAAPGGGKTTLLRELNVALEGQILSIYFSLKNLADNTNGLIDYLGISAQDWQFWCEQGEETVWLIDDIEAGFTSYRLHWLIASLEACQKPQYLLLAARSWYQPFLQDIMAQQLGKSISIAKLPLIESDILPWKGRLTWPQTPWLYKILNEQYHAFNKNNQLKDFVWLQWLAREKQREEVSNKKQFLKELRQTAQALWQHQKKFHYFQNFFSQPWWVTEQHFNQLLGASNNVEEQHFTPSIPLKPYYLLQYPWFSTLTPCLKEEDQQLGYHLHKSWYKRIKKNENSKAALKSKEIIHNKEKNKILKQPCLKKETDAYRILTFQKSSFNHAPWFFLPPITGDIPEQYYCLLNLFEQQTVIYALKIKNDSAKTITAQAEDFIRTMEELQPQGLPYRLLGWSYGGLLVYEITRQLETNGKLVEVVINIDFPAPNYLPLISDQALTVILKLIEQDRKGKSIFKEIRETLKEIQQKPDVTVESLFQEVIRKISNLSGYATLIRSLKIVQKNLECINTYELKEQLLSCPYFVFVAEQQQNNITKRNFEAWQTFVKQPLHIIECGKGSEHFTLFEHADFRRQFKQILQRYSVSDESPECFNQRLLQIAKRARIDIDSTSEFYVPLRVRLSNHTDDIFDIEKYLQETFLNQENSSHCLLLEGQPGGGKSRLIEHIVAVLLEEFINKMEISINLPQEAIGKLWLPVLIRLREFPLLDCVTVRLRNMGFSERDLLFFQGNLKQHKTKLPVCLLFFFDGGDEVNLQENLYQTQIVSHWSDAKAVFAARPEVYPDRELFRDSDGQLILGQLQTLNADEISLFLQEALRIFNLQRNAKSVETIEKFQNIANTHDWLKTPLLLKAVSQIYCRAPERLEFLSNRTQLYRWLEEELIDTAHAYIPKHLRNSEETLSLAYAHYSQSLAYHLWQQQSISNDTSPWSSQDNFTVMLRKAVQVNIKEKHVDFNHFSWREYYLAKLLIQEVLRHNFTAISAKNRAPKILQSQKIDLFNFERKTLLLEFLLTLSDSLEDQAKKQLQQHLFYIVYNSRYQKDEGVLRAAANAITWLNALGVSFSGLDLRGIQIPGANLSGALLDGADLRDANLQGVNLTGSCLNNARLEDCDLTGAIFGELPNLEGNAAIFSLDGQYLIVSKGQEIHFYELPKYILQRKIQTDHEISNFYFLHDGHWLLTKGKTKGGVITLCYWDMKTRECLKTVALENKYRLKFACHPNQSELALVNKRITFSRWDAHTSAMQSSFSSIMDPVEVMAFSPNGDMVAFISGKSNNDIYLVKVATGECTGILKNQCVHHDETMKLHYSPDGKFLLAQYRYEKGRESSIPHDMVYKNFLWDIASEKQFECPNGWRFAFNPNHRQLAISESNDIFLINIIDQSEKPILLQGHSKEISYLIYNPHGEQLASAGADNTICLWDTTEGKCLHIFDKASRRGNIAILAYNSEGQLCVGYRGGKLKRWNTDTKQFIDCLRGHRKAITCLSYSPNNEQLASGDEKGNLYLWEVATGRCLYNLTGHTKRIKTIQYLGTEQLFSSSEDNMLYKWNSLTGEELWKLHLPYLPKSKYSSKNFVNYPTFFCGENEIVSLKLEPLIQTYDLEKEKYTHTLLTYEGELCYLDYSADGIQLILVSENNIQIWDTKDKILILTEKNPQEIETVYRGSSGKKLLLVSRKATFLWDTNIRCLIATIPIKTDIIDRGVTTLSPDEKHAVFYRDFGAIRYWDLATNELLYSQKISESGINNIIYSFDGQQMICGCNNGFIYIVKTDTGECLHTLFDHSAATSKFKLVCSPDSSILLSCSDERLIRLWSNRHQKPTVNLLADQREVFYHKELELNSEYWPTTSICNRLKGSIAGRHILGIKRFIQAMAYHPNQMSVAVTGDDYRLDEYEIQTRKHQRTLQLKAVNFSYYLARRLLVSGVFDFQNQSFCLRDMSDNHELYKIQGPCWLENLISLRKEITNHVSAGSWDEVTIALWYQWLQEWLREIQKQKHMTALDFQYNYTYSFERDENNRQFCADLSRKISSHDFFSSLLYSPNGEQIAQMNSNGIYVWNALSGEIITHHKKLQPREKFRPSPSKVNFLYSPEGEQLIWAEEELLIVADTRTHISYELKHTKKVTAFACRPNTTELVSIANDELLYVWDRVTKEHLLKLSTETKKIKALTFSLDGQYLMLGSQAGKIFLWDCKTWQCKNTITIASEVGRLQWLYDKREGVDITHPWYFLVVDKDNSIKLWCMQSGIDSISAQLRLSNTYNKNLSCKHLSLTQGSGLSEMDLKLLQQRSQVTLLLPSTPSNELTPCLSLQRNLSSGELLSKCLIFSLPRELQEYIFYFLLYKDLFILSLVCHYLYDTLHSETTFRSLLTLREWLVFKPILLDQLVRMNLLPLQDYFGEYQADSFKIRFFSEDEINYDRYNSVAIYNRKGEIKCQWNMQLGCVYKNSLVTDDESLKLLNSNHFLRKNDQTALQRLQKRAYFLLKEKYSFQVDLVGSNEKRSLILLLLDSDNLPLIPIQKKQILYELKEHLYHSIGTQGFKTMKVEEDRLIINGQLEILIGIKNLLTQVGIGDADDYSEGVRVLMYQP